MTAGRSLLHTLLLLLVLCILAQSYPRMSSDYDADFVPPALAKKSLRRLAGSGSRNCFFSPINCVITHDLSTYRRLAGGA